jgi:hypothetical protein
MRVIGLAATALVLAGCATTPVPSSSATPVPEERILAPDFTRPQQGFAMLVVTRDKGFLIATCEATFFVDGVKVAKLLQKEQLRLFVEEGKHLVGVTGDQGICLGGADQQSIEVTRAKPVLLRIAAGNGLGLKIEPSAF